MKDRAFVDTNLLIYSISNDEDKKQKVEWLLQQPFDFLISTQVINEFAHTCLRKNLLPLAEVRQLVEDFFLFFEVVLMDEPIISTAFDLKERYAYSYYDSLIVAAALNKGCSILFSEDLQHNQVLQSKLTISNPLL